MLNLTYTPKVGLQLDSNKRCSCESELFTHADSMATRLDLVSKCAQQYFFCGQASDLVHSGA